MERSLPIDFANKIECIANGNSCTFDDTGASIFIHDYYHIPIIENFLKKENYPYVINDMLGDEVCFESWEEGEDRWRIDVNIL